MRTLSPEPKEVHAKSDQVRPARGNERLIACPYCESREVRHSHLANLIEKMMSLLFSPYRCKDCRRRFWKIR